MKKNDIRYALLDQFHIALLAEIGVSVLLYRVFLLRDALLCKVRWSNRAFVLTNETVVSIRQQSVFGAQILPHV